MNGRVLFLVPARGGSKTVPAKNLRTVAGISLVARAVRRARRAAAILDLAGARVVCTTDDEAIAAEARAWGAEIPFMRPAEISGDEATAVDVALHALDWLEARGEAFEVLALVQPTSPLSAPEDVARAVEAVLTSDQVASATVSQATPVEWLYSLAEGRLHPRMEADARRRQDLAPTYELSGAAFVTRTEPLRKSRKFVIPGRTAAVVMPPERSVDVDTEHDLQLAEAVADATPATPVQLGDRWVGNGRCLVIAEIGVNHNGSVAMARELVDAAAQAGADVVKFQTFDPEAIAAADAPLAEYQAQAGSRGGQRSMLAQLTLSSDAYRELQAHAAAVGIVFLSSPFDEGSAQLLFDLGVPGFKLGSGELTNLPLLRRIAGFGRPMLVSTGMANLREVAAAVDCIAEAAGQEDVPLVLMHCVSRYPAPAEDSNLRAMRTMRSAFGVPVGWSDHTVDSETAATAVALGAAVVEKHITLSRDLPGPDHRASIEPDVFRAMVNRIRAVESTLGSGEKVPVAGEAEVAAVARKSLHWATGLPAGAIVEAGHLAALRPGTGISPAQTASLVGHALARSVVRGRMVEMQDVERKP